jgi:pyridoxal phosphate enzyme (YggS family)
MSVSETLQRNLKSIFAEIGSACARVRRDPKAVELVAVTKYAEWPWVQELSRFHLAFGENRPQQLAARQPLLPDAEWHLIGQLQRNKVRLAVMHSAMIHSVDSIRLLERIAEVAAELNRSPRVLLQVNLSREESKSGFSEDGLFAGWPHIVAARGRVRIEGLMTMAAETEQIDEARGVFRSLRELRDRLMALDDSRAAGLTLPELSMGMSGDFVAAIEEGATLVRIGSRIFEGL